MTLTEDGVWTHLVADLKRPISVTEDGKGGVTVDTFNRLKAGVVVEFTVRCQVAGVDVALYEHPLLIDAMEIQLAARILRRLRVYQEVADSLFADANIKWRLFLEGVAGVSEDGTYIEMINVVEAGHKPQRLPWTPEPNAMVDGFTVHPERERR
jgi:hypothetical protein